MVQVPALITVIAPEDALTVHTVEVVEAKVIVPVFAGDEVALTECVPTDSPYVTPVGEVPKAIVRVPAFPTVMF
jgi:hypothetical protein